MTLRDLIKALEYHHYFDIGIVMFKDCEPPFVYCKSQPYYAEHIINISSNDKLLEKFYDWHVMRLRIYEGQKATFDLVDVR